MSGWIAISRDLLDHEIFAPEPYTEREAWLWLIKEAAWQDTRHRVGNSMVGVPRGALIVTLRGLATKWKWPSEKRVRGFLERLENEEMIGRKVVLGSGKKRTQVSICNYSEYQDAGRKRDANGTQGRTQTGRNKETSKQINKKKEPPIIPQGPLAILGEILPEDLAREFVEYRAKDKPPKLTGRAARGVVNALKEIQEAGHCPQAAIRLAIRRCWKTVYLEWIQNAQRPRPNGGTNEPGRKETAVAAVAARLREAHPGMASGETGDLPGDLLGGPGDDTGVQRSSGDVVQMPLGPAPDGDRCGYRRPAEIVGPSQADPWGDTGGGFVQIGAAAFRAGD